MKKTPRPVVVVLGGAGAMGRITVKDLVETAPGFDVLIADRDEAAATRAARSFRSKRVRAAAADATDVARTSNLLRGAFAVVNSVQYPLNPKVMEAALAAGAHYVDLGGLYHVTLEQLRFHERFVRAGRTALLGVGAAPGITNLLAARAARDLDEVHEIHVLLGSVDHTRWAQTGPLESSYSIETILEEASRPAAAFRKGRMEFVPALSHPVEVRFPSPVGLRRPACTLHSEVATLPLSYADKGVKEVSFRIAFDEALTERLRFLRDVGLTSTEPVSVRAVPPKRGAPDRADVTPMSMLLAVLRKLPAPVREGPLDQYEVVRTVVRGKAGRQRVEEVLDLHCPGIPEWGLGVDADTGCPPSVAVQMLAAGEIDAPGVWAPELVIPPDPFFAALADRGMTVRRRRRAWERAKDGLRLDG